MRILLWAWAWLGWYPGVAVMVAWGCRFAMSETDAEPPVWSFMAVPVAGWLTGVYLIARIT